LNYTYRLSRSAAKGAARLEPRWLRLVQRRLDQLCDDPRDPRLSRELVNRRGLRRSRVGEYRIVYQVDDEIRVLLIETIGPRGEAYE
jgi:mRNA interferase RelE/StbE